jgi:hypothetical protein
MLLQVAIPTRREKRNEEMEHFSCLQKEFSYNDVASVILQDRHLNWYELVTSCGWKI